MLVQHWAPDPIVKMHRSHRGVTAMTIQRRSFLKLTAGTVVSPGFGIGTPAIVRAATPVKMTLPWLPLGTFSYAFVTKKMGFWEKRGYLYGRHKRSADADAVHEQIRRRGEADRAGMD